MQAVNDAPAAGADSYSLDEDGYAAWSPDPGVLGNDSDAEGDSLSAVVATGPAHGALTLNADGSFIYTPDANYHGADSFTYRANDGVADSAEATVTLTINPVNDVPVAAGDSLQHRRGHGARHRGGRAPRQRQRRRRRQRCTAVLVSGPANGTLALNADGSFTYTPTANFNGADSFTYKANDGSADSGAATVAITVNAVDDAPVASDDTFTINEDTSLNVSAPGVLANDSDAEGSSLSAVLVSGVSHGTLTLNSDGSFQYTPDGRLRRFRQLHLQGERRRPWSPAWRPSRSRSTAWPTRRPRSTITSARTKTPCWTCRPRASWRTTPTPTATRSRPSSSPVRRTARLSLGPTGGFVYTPAGDYKGADSFTYKASDGSTDSPVATVALTVNSVNDVSFANADSYTTAEDVPLVVAAPGVIANDTDIDGDPLAASVVTTAEPRHARAQLRRQLRLHAGRGVQRARQLHLPAERRHRRLQRRDGHAERDRRGRRRRWPATTATARAKTRRWSSPHPGCSPTTRIRMAAR